MAAPDRSETPLSVFDGVQPEHMLRVATEQVPDAPTVTVHGSVKVCGAKEPVPWTAEFPEESLAYDGLTILIPGFGGIKRVSRAERHANAVGGRATISYDPARISGNIYANVFNSQELHTETAEAVIYAVRDVISDKRGIPNASRLDQDRVVVSAHSMGGHPATEIGLRHKSLVEAIIYKGSAGFGNIEIDPLGLITEINGYMRSGKIEPNLRNLYRIMRYYTRTPSRTLGEGVTCLRVDIRDKVAKLGDFGIHTAFLGFEKDPLIPGEKTAKAAAEVVNIARVMPRVGHLAPQMYADETAKTTFELQQHTS
ncbi:MAG: alpha/beta hydrolase family protein [Candidatus Saccharimonadales bacterium]